MISTVLQAGAGQMQKNRVTAKGSCDATGLWTSLVESACLLCAEAKSKLTEIVPGPLLLF